MIYYLPLEEMAKHLNVDVSELKKKTYYELENLRDLIEKEKADAIAHDNAKSEEFANLVRKYFTPFSYLKQWFSEDEIIYACAINLTKIDIVQETEIEKGKRLYNQNSEYIGERYGYIKQYSKSGQLLEERKRCLCDVYLEAARYQGTYHGEVILSLLYKKYPELKKFHFKAYSCEYDIERYEIYPENNIYVPFSALMNGDVGAIKKRNIDYCKLYNCGIYTPEKLEERFHDPNVLEFFQIVQTIGNKKNKKI